MSGSNFLGCYTMQPLFGLINTIWDASVKEKGSLRFSQSPPLFMPLPQQQEISLSCPVHLARPRACLFNGETGAGQSWTALREVKRLHWELVSERICCLQSPSSHWLPPFPNVLRVPGQLRP